MARRAKAGNRRHDIANSACPEKRTTHGTILFVFALVGTAMLAFTHDRTEPTITRGQLAAKRALLSQVLPAALYDNDLLASQQSVPPDDLLGTRQPSALWLARRGGKFSGVVLEAVAADGYSGDIALLIGIDADGSVTGRARHRPPRNAGPG